MHCMHILFMLMEKKIEILDSPTLYCTWIWKCLNARISLTLRSPYHTYERFVLNKKSIRALFPRFFPQIPSIWWRCFHYSRAKFLIENRGSIKPMNNIKISIQNRKKQRIVMIRYYYLCIMNCWMQDVQWGKKKIALVSNEPVSVER